MSVWCIEYHCVQYSSTLIIWQLFYNKDNAMLGQTGMQWDVSAYVHVYLCRKSALVIDIEVQA